MKYLITWICRDGSEVLGSAPSRNKAADMCWSAKPHDAVRAIVQNDADQVVHVESFRGLGQE